jgi:hypothetical protein
MRLVASPNSKQPRHSRHGTHVPRDDLLQEGGNLLDKSKERLKGLRMSRTKLRLGVSQQGEKKTKESCEQMPRRHVSRKRASRRGNNPLPLLPLCPLCGTPSPVAAAPRRARTNKQTDLKEDPNSGAEASNGPRDEEEQDEPKDSEERVLGHGLKYCVKRGTSRLTVCRKRRREEGMKRRRRLRVRRKDPSLAYVTFSDAIARKNRSVIRWSRLDFGGTLRGNCCGRKPWRPNDARIRPKFPAFNKGCCPPPRKSHGGRGCTWYTRCDCAS